MNNKGKLLLNKDLYGRAAILAAIQQYHGLALIRVHEKGNHWECTFSDCKYDMQVTMKEFENYVIDMINARV